MKIRVTQEHIDAGTRNSPQYCPIANALKEHLTGAHNIFVDGDNIMWDFGEEETEYYPLTRRLKYRITRYDNSGKMKPFEFDMPTK